MSIEIQLATNDFYAFEEPFSPHSSPQRGDMSIENHGTRARTPEECYVYRKQNIIK